MFVPPAFAADAIQEAAEAGIKTIVCILKVFRSRTWSK
nr:hypothetical protein [Candidatus Brachybacter algidus]